MLRYLVLLLVFAGNLPAIGSDVAPPKKDISLWMENLPKERLPFFSFALVTKIGPKGPIFLAPEKLGILNNVMFPSPKTIKDSIKTNTKSLHLEAAKEKESREDWIENILLKAVVRVVIYMEGQKWLYYYLDGKDLKTIEDPKNTAKKEKELLYTSIERTLGYNSILLDKENEFYLIQIFKDGIPKKAQAIPLKYTKDQVDGRNKKASALLSLLESKGNLAIFKSEIASGQASGEAGTKILISK